MSKRNYKSIEVNNDIDLTIASEELGIVTDCHRLNVREKPMKDSSVVTIVNEHDELVINLNNSTDEWYAVRATSGAEGFCMKNFVTIQ